MSIALVLLFGCGPTEPPEPTNDPVEALAPLPVPKHVVLFGAIPEDLYGGAPPAEPLVALGRKLFFDVRLSPDGARSCATCHPLDRWGAGAAEEGPRSEGDRRSVRNPPSVYNAGLQFALHWDASLPTLEAQAQAALVDPQQSGFANVGAVSTTLKGLADYVEPFAQAFPDTPDRFSAAQVGQAIAAFERGLTTPGSKVDRYLSGEREALTSEEVAGFDRFVRTGCNSCHSGVLFGGAQVQRLGAAKPYDTSDPGREAVTGAAEDRHLFKVPSLRNVAETGPWLHDGSVTELAEVVRRMAWHQLGQELKEEEIAEIVGFLRTLTGELPSEYIVPKEEP